MLRNTFPKSERLCSKKAFSYIFEHGESLNADVLKFFYALDVPEDFADSNCAVAFAVPKRNFKRAVDRNLLKRRMREAYRLHKHDLHKVLTQNGKNLVLLIKYQPRHIQLYTPIEKGMIKGFKRLEARVENSQT
ncbi:MAG: ribonuclease P protein component [Bacteroidota bacterium]